MKVQVESIVKVYNETLQARYQETVEEEKEATA
jgi:hypothetical protein